jgi:hypothetical protein
MLPARAPLVGESAPSSIEYFLNEPPDSLLARADIVLVGPRIDCSNETVR